MQQDDARGNGADAGPLPKAERLFKESPGSNLQERESAAETKRVNHVGMPIFQREGQCNRTNHADKISDDEIPPGCAAMIFGGQFEINAGTCARENKCQDTPDEDDCSHDAEYAGWVGSCRL
jgi:hypothetical protein